VGNTSGHKVRGVSHAVVEDGAVDGRLVSEACWWVRSGYVVDGGVAVVQPTGDDLGIIEGSRIRGRGQSGHSCQGRGENGDALGFGCGNSKLNRRGADVGGKFIRIDDLLQEDIGEVGKAILIDDSLPLIAGRTGNGSGGHGVGELNQTSGIQVSG
jgi:hypothetical protein